MRNKAPLVVGVVLLLGAGCGGHDPAAVDAASTPDAELPRALRMNVVAGPSYTTLFTEGDDLNCTPASPGLVTFPETGTCIEIGDVAGCIDGTRVPSCLTDVHVEVAGQLTVTAGIEPGETIELGGPAPAGSTVVLTGCGGTARIPIDAAIGPSSTVTAETDSAAQSITVAWTTDQPATSSLVELSAGTFARSCHTDQLAHVFSGQPFDLSSEIIVSALVAGAPASTELGTARVWHAGPKSTISPTIQ